MATRKIVFFIIIGIVGILVFFGIWNLSKENTAKKANLTKTLSVWVVWDTTEQYQTLFSDFGSYDPVYKNTAIDIRVFPDYEAYQRILLSTLADWNGPDIFMVEWGGDTILESKLAPIPETFIELNNFEKRYEDIFLPLLSSEWEGKNIIRSIIGAPLGYETLGVFYHKSLVRNFPKTWSEIDNITIAWEKDPIFPTNIWLGPTYNPDAVDLIAYFLWKSGARSTSDLNSGAGGISEYLDYGDATLSPPQTDWQNDTITTSLNSERDGLSQDKLSAIDLFIRWRIAMLVWYPSTIREIEKAEKRANGQSLWDLILTERLPEESLGKERLNIARYKYIGVSQKSENPEAAARLIEYVMSDIWAERAIEAFPILISPIRSYVEQQKNTPLSDVFARTRLDAFIPELDEKLFAFNYQIKWEYRRIFREYIDRNGKVDINNMFQDIKSSISCQIESLESGSISEKCTTNN